MSFTNVDLNKAFNVLSADEMKERLFDAAGYNSWAGFSEKKKRGWIFCTKQLAEIRKMTPEQRYLTFVIQEFTRFARAIKRAGYVESDKCIDVYAYDVIGEISPMRKQLLQFPNSLMRTNTEKSLVLAVAIDKLVAQILDEELAALDALYYQAFPTDIELKDEVKAENFNEDPEPPEEKPQKTTFAADAPEEKPQKTTFAADAPEGKKKMKFEDFLKMLGDLAEEIEKAKPSTVAKPSKPQTKQDIATDFINSATKTQKKNDKFGW